MSIKSSVDSEHDRVQVGHTERELSLRCATQAVPATAAQEYTASGSAASEQGGSSDSEPSSVEGHGSGEPAQIPHPLSASNGGAAPMVTIHDYPSDALITKKELASAFGLCERTVLRMVARHEIPPAIQMGKRSVWLVGHVQQWIAERAEQQVNSAKAEMRRLNLNFN